jgi:formylglycine-generating enzyme required for sulfatase activity
VAAAGRPGTTIRSANRNWNTTENRNDDIGFRVARAFSAGAGAITVPPGMR